MAISPLLALLLVGILLALLAKSGYATPNNESYVFEDPPVSGRPAAADENREIEVDSKEKDGVDKRRVQQKEHDDNDEDVDEDVKEDLFLIKGLDKIGQGAKLPDEHDHHRLPKSYDVLILEEVARDRAKGETDEPVGDDENEEDEDEDDDVNLTGNTSTDDKNNVVKGGLLSALCTGGLASPDVLIGLLLFSAMGATAYFFARKAYLKHRMNLLSSLSKQYKTQKKQDREGYSEIPSPSIAEIAMRQV